MNLVLFKSNNKYLKLLMENTLSSPMQHIALITADIFTYLGIQV